AMRGRRPGAPRAGSIELQFRGACGSQEGRHWAFIWTREKFGYVFGSVDVEHQPGKTQDVRGHAFRMCLVEMGAEAAGTKAALDAIGRRAHQCVGTGAVGGWDDN